MDARTEIDRSTRRLCRAAGASGMRVGFVRRVAGVGSAAQRRHGVRGRWRRRAKGGCQGDSRVFGEPLARQGGKQSANRTSSVYTPQLPPTSSRSRTTAMTRSPAGRLMLVGSEIDSIWPCLAPIPSRRNILPIGMHACAKCCGLAAQEQRTHDEGERTWTMHTCMR